MEDKKKSGVARRLCRLAVCFALVSVSFLILMAVTLPLWINPVATCVAERIVPGITGTGFSIEKFFLNPYSGSVRIGGVRLSNPRGFGEAAAFSMSDLSIDLTVGSLLSDVILVREIVVSDPFVSYYSHDGTNNFDIILANVKKKDDAKSAEQEASEPKAERSGKKVVIERLRITGAKVKLVKSDLVPSLMVPPLELTDIGRKSGGATIEEAWSQIANGVMKSVTAAGEGLGALGGILGVGVKDSSGKIGSGVKNLFKVLENQQ